MGTCCANFPACGHYDWQRKTEDALRRAKQMNVWELNVPIPKELGGGDAHFTYKPFRPDEQYGWHVTTSVGVPGVGQVKVHDWLNEFKPAIDVGPVIKKV